MPPSTRPKRPLLVRWGQSPYEEGEKLTLERQRIEELGIRTVYVPAEVFPIELREARVLVVTSMKRVGPGVLDQAPSLELLVTTTSGYDHLDVTEATRRGISVVRCPMARRDAVVESSLGLILGLLRDIPRLNDEAREGYWARADLPDRGITLLRGLDVGVIGLGVIGSRMVEVLHALGAVVHGNDPHVDRADAPALPVPEMLATCRVVTMHNALERGAPPVLGRPELEGARRDLILVNTARGRVIDLKAALELLKADRLGGLGIDVFPDEPWPDLAVLAAHPRAIATPHGAGYHDRLGERIADELVALLQAWLSGNPFPNRVA
jgi:D-3-phosphoglycerate dehydrogenase / 2-oxoglutarate reductase